MPPSRKLNRTPPPAAQVTADASSVALQERLHELLSRLSTVVEKVRTWPQGGDDASVHMELTGKLIQSIRHILQGIDRVEVVLKNNASLRQRLQTCPIPINLLDLLDYGGGLNPECFARGLLAEAVGQLEGLNRRKLALERLGDAVHAGLLKKQKEQKKQQQQLKQQQQQNKDDTAATSAIKPKASLKRERDEEDDEEGAVEEDAPPAKKQLVEKQE